MFVFIILGQACYELNNFNSIAWIVHGLVHPGVSRLTTVWQAVPKKFTEAFEELEELVSPKNNFAAYRNLTENAKSPIIPLVGK